MAKRIIYYANNNPTILNNNKGGTINLQKEINETNNLSISLEKQKQEKIKESRALVDNSFDFYEF